MPKLREGERQKAIEARLPKSPFFSCPKCGGQIYLGEGLHCYYCLECSERYAYSDEMRRKQCEVILEVSNAL